MVGRCELQRAWVAPPQWPCWLQPTWPLFWAGSSGFLQLSSAGVTCSWHLSLPGVSTEASASLSLIYALFHPGLLAGILTLIHTAWPLRFSFEISLEASMMPLLFYSACLQNQHQVDDTISAQNQAVVSSAWPRVAVPLCAYTAGHGEGNSRETAKCSRAFFSKKGCEPELGGFFLSAEMASRLLSYCPSAKY
jgi:hypothetical protein